MGGNDDTRRQRPLWQTPVLIEDDIVDLTQNTQNRPGDDGGDRFGGYYATSGIS